MERIDKLLANMGLGSRKEIKMMIKRGEILINGTACTDAAAKVDLAADQVTAAGRAMTMQRRLWTCCRRNTSAWAFFRRDASIGMQRAS